MTSKEAQADRNGSGGTTVMERASMAVSDVGAQVRESSTDSLVLGTVFAAGASGGMLLSRAPRMLVALAFGPALVFGGMLLGRRGMRLDEPAHTGRR